MWICRSSSGAREAHREPGLFPTMRRGCLSELIPPAERVPAPRTESGESSFHRTQPTPRETESRKSPGAPPAPPAPPAAAPPAAVCCPVRELMRRALVLPPPPADRTPPGCCGTNLGAAPKWQRAAWSSSPPVSTLLSTPRVRSLGGSCEGHTLLSCPRVCVCVCLHEQMSFLQKQGERKRRWWRSKEK